MPKISPEPKPAGAFRMSGEATMPRPAPTPTDRIDSIDREIAAQRSAFLTHYFAGDQVNADKAQKCIDELLDERWKV